ncbi:hypothetical protein ES704_03647 [subsurface metagenome]|jgi:hypothetical protein
MTKKIKLIPIEGEYPFLLHYLRQSDSMPRSVNYILVYAENLTKAKKKLMEIIKNPDDVLHFGGIFDSSGPGNSTIL